MTRRLALERESGGARLVSTWSRRQGRGSKRPVRLRGHGACDTGERYCPMFDDDCMQETHLLPHRS